MILKTAKDWNRFSKAMMALCVVPLIVAAVFAVRTHLFLQHSLSTKGRIVQLVETSNHQGGTAYAPVFTFKDIKGQTQKVYSSMFSYPPVGEVGAEINILYDPSTPNSAKENSFMDLWILTIVPAGLGVFYFLLFWAVAYFTGRRMTANQSLG